MFRVKNQKKMSAVINRVSLILRLRSKQHSKRKQRTKVKPGTETKDSGGLPGVRGGGEEVQSDEGKSGRKWKNSKSRRKKKKKKKGKSGRKQSRRVKVLVQAMSEKSGRFKRVAVQRFNVDRKFRWIKLPIPASLVSRAALSSNQTLVLRVRCKRCYKGRVSIDSVLPRKKSRLKAEGELGRSLNPNRPYLVIRTADKPLAAQTPPSPPRSARHLHGLCRPSQSDSGASCCAQRVRVTFKDLGWDHWIVHPEGFHTVLCRGVCTDVSSNGRERTSGTQTASSDGQRESPSGQRLVPANKHRMFAGIGQRAGGIANGDTEKVYGQAGRRPAQTCLPKDHSSLEVMYYRDQNTLLHTLVPDLVSRSCGCLLK